MLGKSVLMEKRGHISTITLNRPEVLNSMNKELIEELIRVLVLTGSGK